MWSFKVSARVPTIGVMLVGFTIGLLPLAGCGEKEAPIIPSSKSKDELQKDIENPFGVEVKTGKVKNRSSRRD